ncbi:hypothetical protein [Acinetobacter guerrae]|uniref:hypothetical protein n=1 Tax=Acinetobacter guerrae TaxID=1843371 RepID=UPI00125FF368|nr:hypothetical protein [Acinetobacter guerrae]
MIKKIIGVLIIVFSTLAFTIILYWKESQFDSSLSDLLIYLVALPVLISLVILTPWLIYRFYQAQKRQKQSVTALDATPSQQPYLETQWLKLHIYSAFSKSALGENEEIIQAIQDHQSPKLDTKLVNSYGLPILSYRIDELDERLINDGSSSISVRQQRIIGLIQLQIEQQSSVLAQIAEHLRRSSLFFETEHVHEYRMHPAWIDPQAENDANEMLARAHLQPISRLNRLNVHMILSEDLRHLWDNVICTEFLHEALGELGLLPQKIQVQYYFWEQQSVSIEWLNLLEQLAQQQTEISLIIYVDSELDQDVLDARISLNEQYIPAEFAGSCCVSALNIHIADLNPIKHLSLALNQAQIAAVLDELDLKELQQYQSEQPFVIVPENISDPKVVKQLNHQFEQTPIEAHHYLYISSSLGHSQHLAKIYAYMLAMQFPKDQTIFIALAQTPAIAVLIQSALPLQHQEAAETL